ncbi:BH1289 [Halalkalibacterium halodurans C-125]|jgi:hypothetical protein|uniref:BH1289 protein n=1 Tax=Halalkalibacterium halodurans (strain ATCC BAA-125 / DSM 18197 / FERM 7344 / JCM 9153 / C-125) TaxID=272558 RepID=Q9KDC4_HALH5|nr:BH1289 [Halalkalibacterium halodurans C-125]
MNDLKEICECNLDHTSSMIYFLTVIVQKMHVQVYVYFNSSGGETACSSWMTS